MDVLQHLLHVLPRLLEGDRFHPVDGIGLAVAEVAILRHPLD